MELLSERVNGIRFSLTKHLVSILILMELLSELLAFALLLIHCSSFNPYFNGIII